VLYFLMFHIFVIVYPRSSISLLMSSKFAVAWICLRTTLKLLSCFNLYVWTFVLLLLSFHNVYVCDGVLWLDRNLLLYDLYYILCSPIVISFNSFLYENDGKLLIIATKMNRGLMIFPTLTLVLASSCFSSSPTKELVVAMGLARICSFLIVYEGLTFRGCFGFSFYR
jgi:hypothetical protein